MRSKIILSAKQIKQLQNDGTTRHGYPIIPRQSTPHIAPLLMWPDYDEYGWQETDEDDIPIWDGCHPEYPYGDKWFSNDYGPVGRVLAVREEWAIYGVFKDGTAYSYRADGDKSLNWQPASRMPREAIRLRVTITSVTAEPFNGVWHWLLGLAIGGGK